MSEVLQTNIFFVITSVAVVVFTALLCIALWHLIRILRNVQEMTDRLKRGSEQLAEDVQDVRTFVRTGIIGTAKRFITGAMDVGSAKRRTRKKKAEEEADDDGGIEE